MGSNKGRRNNEVERRSRFISSSLSPIWLLRSSGLHGKVGSNSASKRCRRNGNIVVVVVCEMAVGGATRGGGGAKTSVAWQIYTGFQMIHTSVNRPGVLSISKPPKLQVSHINDP